MVEHFGIDVVRAYMGHVQDNAEESVRRLLSRLDDGLFRVEIDQGTAVEVRDHGGQGGAHGEGRLHRHERAAAEQLQRAGAGDARRYPLLFRVMVEEPIPMSAGCLKPIEIVIPRRLDAEPGYPAAVVAGNVETSQIVTNGLFAALGALGSAQGTMNNLTFGNARCSITRRCALARRRGPVSMAPPLCTCT